MGGTPACRPSPHCSLLLRATRAIRPVLTIPVKTLDLPLLSSWPKTGRFPTPGQLVAPLTLSCAHPDNWRGCPGPPWPCLWTESGAWSPAAQPLQRPRALHLGVAALPAHRTWVRKAEWPVGAPQGWRPQSLSATRSTTRSPPAGVRAEELHRGPSQTTDWTGSPWALPPPGQWGSSLKGPRGQIDKKVKGGPGTPHCPPLLWRR